MFSDTMSNYITAFVSPIDIVTLKASPNEIEEISYLNGMYLDIEACEINNIWILEKMYVNQNHLQINNFIDLIKNIIDGIVNIKIIDENENILYNDYIKSNNNRRKYAIVRNGEIEILNYV